MTVKVPCYLKYDFLENHVQCERLRSISMNCNLQEQAKEQNKIVMNPLK